MKTRKVQYIICLIILLLFANQAGAAQWVLYQTSDVGDESYDKSSIKKLNNNIISMWTKTIYNDVGKLRNYSVLKKMDKAPNNPYMLSHELVLLEIDCLNKKVKVSSIRICDKRGGIIASEMPSHGVWKDIVPNSNYEKLKNQFCGFVKNSKIKKK
jgi:hypothetical protein